MDNSSSNKKRRYRHHTRYSDEIAEQICKLLQLGMPRSLVAEAVRVSRSTFYQWLKSKKEFRERVERAEHEAIAYYSAQIYRAAGESWQAAAWWLERRYPHEFGRKQVMAVSGGERESSFIIRLFDVQQFAERGEMSLAGELSPDAKNNGAFSDNIKSESAADA